MREFGTALNRLKPATDAKDRGEADKMLSTRQESAAGSGGGEASAGLIIHPGQTATSVTAASQVPYRSSSVTPDQNRAGKRKVSAPVYDNDQHDFNAAKSTNTGCSRRSGKAARRTANVPTALQTTESTPPTSNSAAKRKAENVISDSDSDYIDSEDEHTNTRTHTHSRLRVASFFAHPATRVGNVRQKHKTKKRRKQQINLDDSEDDDTDDSDDNTQHTRTNSTHTRMNTTNTTDDTHRRGHPPSVQQQGRSMPTRGDRKESGTWYGSDHQMDV